MLRLANGATGPGQLRLYEDTDNGTNFTAGFKVGTQSADIDHILCRLLMAHQDII